MAYIIYIAKNRITGDEYVGVTKQRLEDRRWKHFSDANRDGGCRIFCRAIQKYGREAFDWSVHIGDLDYDDAMQAEIDTIAARRPAYNITAGGRGFRGVKKSPEHIAKIAEKLKGKKRTPESIARMVQTRREPAYREHQATMLRGRPRPPEVIAKVLATKKLRDSAQAPKPVKNRSERVRGRPVVCVTTGDEFPSVRDACAFVGVTPRAISRACRSGAPSKGMHFRFKDGELVRRAPTQPRKPQFSAEEIRRRATRFEHYRHLGPRASAKAVRCESDGNVFESASAAAVFYGASKSALIELCLGNPRRKTVAGRRFSYVS